MRLAIRSIPVLVLSLACALPGCALFIHQPNVVGWAGTMLSVKSPKSGMPVMEVSYGNEAYGLTPISLIIVPDSSLSNELFLESGSERYPLDGGHDYELRIFQFSSSGYVELYEDGEKVAELNARPQAWSVVARTLTVGITDQGYDNPYTTDRILLEVYYDHAKKVFTIVDET